MKAVISLLLTLFFMLIVSAVGILAMIYGWGLQPKSWPVIIGATLFTGCGALVVGAVQGVLKD